MSCSRLFLIGVVSLLFGVHFRMFDSFILNERTSNFIQQRIEKNAKPTAASDVTLDGEEHMIMREDDVLAVLE